MNSQPSVSRRKEAVWHGIFWLVFLYFSLVSFSKGKFQADLHLFTATWILLFIITFYVNYCLVLPRVFNPLNWWKALVGFMAIGGFFILLRYLVEQQLAFLLFGQRNYFSGTPTADYIVDNLYFGTQPIFASTIFWLVVSTIRLAEENKRMIEEQKNTEIKFLKAQINPHFVFNTLNNIYAMVHFKSPKSLPAIEKLSSIMRFTTYQAHRSQIKLKEEINYLEACIELEELRHAEESIVKRNIQVDDMEREIPPYILSPLVENALKHGALSAAEPVELELISNHEILRFVVRNKIGNHKKDEVSGIGLQNLERRLYLLFPGRYKLETVSENGTFIASIEIRWT